MSNQADEVHGKILDAIIDNDTMTEYYLTQEELDVLSKSFGSPVNAFQGPNGLIRLKVKVD